MFQIYNHRENYLALLVLDPLASGDRRTQQLLYVLAGDAELYDLYRAVFIPEKNALSDCIEKYMASSWGPMANPGRKMLLQWALHRYDPSRFRDVPAAVYARFMSGYDEYALIVAGAKKIASGEYHAVMDALDAEAANLRSQDI